MEGSDQGHAPAALPPGKVPRAAHWIEDLSASQSRSWPYREESFASSGIEPRALCPLPGHYIDWATPDPLLLTDRSIIRVYVV
jgi:hypothetical protein